MSPGVALLVVYAILGLGFAGCGGTSDDPQERAKALS
jgi:hypothetical protein